MTYGFHPGCGGHTNTLTWVESGLKCPYAGHFVAVGWSPTLADILVGI